MDKHYKFEIIENELELFKMIDFTKKNKERQILMSIYSIINIYKHNDVCTSTKSEIFKRVKKNFKISINTFRLRLNKLASFGLINLDNRKITITNKFRKTIKFNDVSKIDNSKFTGEEKAHKEKENRKKASLEELKRIAKEIFIEQSIRSATVKKIVMNKIEYLDNIDLKGAKSYLTKLILEKLEQHRVREEKKKREYTNRNCSKKLKFNNFEPREYDYDKLEEELAWSNYN